MTTSLPAWMLPLRDALGTLTTRDLTRVRPPRGAEPRQAGVLVLLGDGADGPEVLLLERAHDLRLHAGQVAFPGGGREPQDRDLRGTALREAEEETGLDPAGVEVVGDLPDLYVPPSNFTVTPVLAYWREPSRVWPVDAGETASVHVVPVSELLDPRARVRARHVSGFIGPAFVTRDLLVWGFTAGILARLFAYVGWERPWDESRVVDVADEARRHGERPPRRDDVGGAVAGADA